MPRAGNGGRVLGQGAGPWIERLRRWAEGDPNVRLALVVGSRARSEAPADDYSDIDLVLFVKDPEPLFRGDGGVGSLGSYWTSHRETNALGTGTERRFLFRDGQDVDVAVFPDFAAPLLRSAPEASEVLRRGFVVLVNKDGVEVTAPERSVPAPPSEDEYANLANDVRFHLVWAAKKLARGERWTALGATNGYLRLQLVRAARWQALSRSADREVWHESRFLERWAAPELVRWLPRTVATYDDESIVRALRAVRTAIRRIGRELEARHRFSPPMADEAGFDRYLDRLLARVVRRSGRTSRVRENPSVRRRSGGTRRGRGPPPSPLRRIPRNPARRPRAGRSAKD